jgi:hypothetical protein
MERQITPREDDMTIGWTLKLAVVLATVTMGYAGPAAGANLQP